MNDSSVSSAILNLASGNCVPCETTVPFDIDEIQLRLKDLPGWILQSGSIQKEFRFKSYSAGLEFACTLGNIAQAQDHHPDMMVGWRRVRVMLSTHAINGLSANDFIMAAKSEIEYRKLAGR